MSPTFVVVNETVGATEFEGGPVTTAVAAEPWVPSGDTPFEAVTYDSIVWPTSSWTSVYVLAVAPPIVAQLLPLVSQRFQAYVKVKLAGKPLHEPLLVESWSPIASVPATVGTAVFSGDPVTTPVIAENADAALVLFVAVTFTRILIPSSPSTGA
jgi:hypothetical protein